MELKNIARNILGIPEEYFKLEKGGCNITTMTVAIGSGIFVSTITLRKYIQIK